MPDNEPPIEAAMLRTFVAGRDVACPGCGYNVRDLPTDVCPECGQQLRLSLGLAEPKQAALIAGLVGLSAGAGLGGLLLVYAAIVTLIMGPGPRGLDKFIIIINALGFAIHAAAAGVWIWKWNRIRRLSPGWRRLLVLVCWTMPILFIVIFATSIR